MRDAHRLKEKYELSFDNRQVVTLTVTSLVVLGGVFFLGVVLGKKLAGDQIARPAPADLLSAADQKTKALDALDAASLTFPDELTRKKAPLAQAPAEPAQKPAEPAQKPVAAKGPSPAAAQPDLAPLEEPPARSELDEALEKLDQEEAAAARTEPVPTRTREDAGGLKDAFGRAATPRGTAADGNWTLQLSAHQDRAEAERFAAGLRDKGYAPYIVEATIPERGVWFRVRMGRFPTKDAAGRYMEDFKRETSMNAIVTTN